MLLSARLLERSVLLASQATRSRRNTSVLRLLLMVVLCWRSTTLICYFIYLSIHPSIHPSIYIYIYMCVCVCVCICACVRVRVRASSNQTALNTATQTATPKPPPRHPHLQRLPRPPPRHCMEITALSDYNPQINIDSRTL